MSPAESLTPVLIGLDPGVQTGYARWDCAARHIAECATIKIHHAMEQVRTWSKAGHPILVLFEDARLRRWGFHARDSEEDKYGSGVREGAGAAKRDAKIWDDFLADLGVPYLPRHPRKKLDALLFKATTGYQGKTSQHARDAAMIIHGHTPATFQSLMVEWEGKKRLREVPLVHAPRRGRRF